MQPERLPESGPCVVQERYDEADLRRLFAWHPDVDALLEAILALPQPQAVAFRPSVAEDWASFRTLAAEIMESRRDAC